jgi:hypothetical protein
MDSSRLLPVGSIRSDVTSVGGMLAGRCWLMVAVLRALSPQV